MKKYLLRRFPLRSNSFRLVILQSWRFRGLKVTEHEVPGGDAPMVVIRITGRPLTFPTGD